MGVVSHGLAGSWRLKLGVLSNSGMADTMSGSFVEERHFETSISGLEVRESSISLLKPMKPLMATKTDPTGSRPNPRRPQRPSQSVRNVSTEQGRLSSIQPV